MGERAIKVMELVPPNVAYNYSTKYVQTRYTGSYKLCELRIIYLLDIFICHKQSCFYTAVSLDGKDNTTNLISRAVTNSLNEK